MSDYPTSQVETWLYERGFEKASPFATTVADQEKEYLAEELFMPVNEYDRIKGPETLIVFAPRGGGKSALRVRLAAISSPQNEKADVLAVCCTDLEPLLVQYRADGCLARCRCRTERHRLGKSGDSRWHDGHIWRGHLGAEQL